ncbi:hypothetical protein [Metabacillus arenae]|uniref:Uncharacterized protein n=1 Tax=Metabacillus arenae TaxID=2771434 RepID=A0A926NRB1_9BACI|nr:hypothetical protein [Metabacillus arenae]MBD1382557.1 hypothetical protein [Metabacillus arenae]
MKLDLRSFGVNPLAPIIYPWPLAVVSIVLIYSLYSISQGNLFVLAFSSFLFLSSLLLWANYQICKFDSLVETGDELVEEKLTPKDLFHLSKRKLVKRFYIAFFYSILWTILIIFTLLSGYLLDGIERYFLIGISIIILGVTLTRGFQFRNRFNFVMNAPPELLEFLDGEE